MDDPDSAPAQRSRRQKVDRNGRLAAFEKLKQLKGSKNKYEVTEFENVYEEVNEKEYSKRVLERQVDDWIVDDDGSGYVEDGREIFDDDLDDEAITSASKSKESGRRGKKSTSIDKGIEKKHIPSSSIRNMLMNMPPRKRKREGVVKLEEDDVLGDIMQELHGNSNSKRQAVETELSPQSYLRSLAAALPRHQKSEKKIFLQKPVHPVIQNGSLLAKTNTEDKIANMKGEICDNEEDDIITCEASQLETDVEASKDTQIIEDFDSNDGFPNNQILDALDTKPLKVEKCEESGNKNNNNVPVVEENLITDLDVEVVKKPIGWRSAGMDCTKDDGMLAAWASMADCVQETSEPVSVNISSTELPLTKNLSGNEVLRFFWWDAYEEPYKIPGVVYLFGKVWIETAKTYVSCCVSVKDIERRIYILPREERWDLEANVSTGQEIKFADVYEEFSKKIAEKYKILQFKCRKVERSYCFNVPGVPVVSEYLEVKYPAHNPALAPDLQGETFCHVFGTRTTPLELLLLERKIRGPCWLDVHSPQQVTNAISWCKVEVTCSKMEHLEVCPLEPKLAPPPLVIMALNMRSVTNVRSSQSEVVMISCLVHNNFPVDRAAPQPPFQQHFCVVTRPSDGTFPIDVKEYLTKYQGTRVEIAESERALLGYMVAKVSRADPDLIVGHDIHGFALEMVLQRMHTHKVLQWSKLGRLRRSNLLSFKGKFSGLERMATSGRMICDMKLSAKELIRARSYDLSTLCQQVLHLQEDQRRDLTPNEVRGMYGSSQSLVQLISLTMQDAAYVLRLMCELNVLPLALQITNIAGNIMSRTLLGGRSERNEFLLLHAFTEKNYIVPDKEYTKKKTIEDFEAEGEDGGGESSRKSRRKPQYAGGLVLEPKKGFYDKMILLMDFNSLYPSIIQEYNICFTTVKHQNIDQEDTEAQLPESNLESGILPTEIRKLVESRRMVKKLMAASDITTDLKMQYNIRQMALKLTANSMYGCLGFSHSRFYAKPIAALVTAKGREILMNTKALVEKMNYEVIYGDTDSIMINTKILDYDQVFKIGQKIKQEVNRLYKLVELEVDGVFKYLLLLKKKKYAAVTLTRTPNGDLKAQQEHKGLDIVRRDWSQLSAEAGRFVLNQILSDLSPDDRIENIHSHLTKLSEDLHAGLVPLQLLAITKQLTKSVEEYADKKSLPHVQVAMRLNSRSGGKRIKAGDTVSYVICEDGSNLPASQRAYHVDELKGNDKLKVDVNYYLSQQIHPVVSRLCDPVEGTDAARIAVCLGLDPSHYVQIQKQEHEFKSVDEGEQLILSDAEKYKHCDRFRFTCMNDKCGEIIVMDGPCKKTDGNTVLYLEKCGNPECSVAPYTYLANIQNRLTTAIRHYIHLYYMSWLVCEDPACMNRTRRMPLWFCRGYPVCNMCEKGLMYREYTDSELYNQLSFFHHIFDLSKVQELKQLAGKIPDEIEVAYAKLLEQVERILACSAYFQVDLSNVFAKLTSHITPAIK